MSTEARTVWRRRTALMGAVGLVIALPVTLLVRSGDEDQPASGATEPPSLQKSEVDRRLDVRFRLPKNWRKVRSKGVLRLQRKRGGTRIAISAPGPPRDVSEIHDATLEDIRRSYSKVKVLERMRGTRVGGLRSRVAVLKARQGKGNAGLRFLVATAAGKDRAYLTVVVTAGTQGGVGLVEAQAILNKLRLKG